MNRRSAASAAIFVALISLTPALPAAAASTCAIPMVIGHRAGANLAPENTTAGIRAVAATGVPMVEMDVRYTASGYPYLLHDETLDRTTTGTGPIASKWVSDMGSISAADYAPWNTDPRFGGRLANGSPRTSVPFTGDWLQAIKDSNVSALLDAKVTPTRAGADTLMSYVNRSDLALASKLIYMGDDTNVRTMHGWYPQLAYGLIEYPGDRIPTPAYLRSLGASTYVIPWDSVSAELVAYYHAGGIKVFTWTSDRPSYDDAAHWTELATDRVDALITNEPAAAEAAYAASCQPAAS